MIHIEGGWNSTKPYNYNQVRVALMARSKEALWVLKGLNPKTHKFVRLAHPVVLFYARK